MEKTTTARYVRISEKKLRMAIRGIRGKKVSAILPQLTMARHKAGGLVAAVIESTVAQFPKNIEREKLVISTVQFDKGPRFKRWRPGGRGVAKRYEKKSAHITIGVKNGE